MRVSLGYRNFVAALLTAASAIVALPQANLGAGPGPLTRKAVHRVLAKTAKGKGRVAAPTAKMVEEAKQRASGAAKRQKFDIYRRRLCNKRIIGQLQAC